MDSTEASIIPTNNIASEKVRDDVTEETGLISENPANIVEKSGEKMEAPNVLFATEDRPSLLLKAGRTNNWNFIWDTSQEGISGEAAREPKELKPESNPDPVSMITQQNLIPSRVEQPVLKMHEAAAAEKASVEMDHREVLFFERREREIDRRERELDRRERELERRERELERRQREFDQDKARLVTDVHRASHWQEAIDNLRNRIEQDLLAERKKAVEREALLEAKVMTKVNEVLENERQLYGVMRMSDNEVNEMVENSVGYLLQNDDERADRVRFQSLLYLSQERLASEAGLHPPAGSDSLSLAWRLALGPSVVTEDRLNKALELLKDKNLDNGTKKVLESKKALEYAAEYTSHLRKEGIEMSDYSFSLGRIPREDYMESVERQSKQNTVDFEALKILVDFVSPEA